MMELSVLMFTVLLSIVRALPVCESGCSSDSFYCKSTCYTNEENTLYTIKEKFGSSEIECIAGSIGCPDDLTGFSFSQCQSQCLETTKCTAYIKDLTVAGDRCKFLEKCLNIEEAGVLVPCEDCESERSCFSCPSFKYLSGPTVAHWLCEMEGDAYTADPVEGVACKLTARCLSDKPEQIFCGLVEEEPEQNNGIWINAADGKPVANELLDDAPCLCNDLTIISSDDNALVCGEETKVDENGNWVINQTGDRCDLICGMSFIPIQCKFNEEKDGVSWHIDGDIELGDATCLACNLHFHKEEDTSRKHQKQRQVKHCAILDF